MPNSLDATNPVEHGPTPLSGPVINLDRPIPLKELTRQATRKLERKIIRKALEAHNWNRKESARALCISYRSLLYKIKEAGLLHVNREGCNSSSPKPSGVDALTAKIG